MNKVLRFLAYSVILITLMPAIELGGFLFKPDLLVVGFLCLLILADKRNYIFQLKEVKSLWIIAVIIFFLMLISDNLGIYYFEPTFSFYFPRESIQIFARVAAAVSFMYLGFQGIIRPVKFLRIVSLVFMVGLLFGILQKMDVPLIKEFSLNYYALSEEQGKAISSNMARVFGTSGNVLTWAGLSMLMFFYFYFLTPGRIFKVAGVTLALGNLLATGSRGGIVATVVAFAFIQVYRTVFIDKRLGKRVIRIGGLISIAFMVFFVLINYLPKQYEFIAYRFLYAQEDLTYQGRGAQLQSYLGIFEGDAMLYLLGIGKPVMDGFSLMEIELAYLLFAYGIVGFILHYLLVWKLVGISKKLRLVKENYYLFILSTFVGFMIFSIGFYFFREITSGLPFWWLSGYLIGEMLRRHVIWRKNVAQVQEDGLIRNTHN